MGVRHLPVLFLPLEDHIPYDVAAVATAPSASRVAETHDTPAQLVLGLHVALHVGCAYVRV